MTNILDDLKGKRFIVSPCYLKEYGLDLGEHLVILIDYGFWVEHIDELTEWCEKNQVKIRGMTLLINSDEKLSLFLLRWS